MGKPGLWALAADYTSYAFTTLSDMLGDESIGVEESRLFSATRSKLSVKRDFIPIQHVGTTHYLLDRTSCCLYYKVEGGGYCHSCPHRPLDERIELVKKHMEEEAAA
jgi:ferric iron reductase protein FhuF